MRAFFYNFVSAGIICLFAFTCFADSVVVFNEIMYHPAGNEAQMEWLELHNQMAVDVDVSDWSLVGGVDYTFPVGSIIPGDGYLVVAVSPSTVEALTGLTNIYGPFSGRLSNAGENLELRDNSDRIMDKLSYKDSGIWPVAADGSGASLSKIHPDVASSHAQNWAASSEINGSPGAENFSVISVIPEKLVFNEIMPASGTGFWLEVVNPGAENLQLNGVRIRCSSETNDYIFPPAIIPPEEYHVITASELGFSPADGDKLFLYSSNTMEVLDGVAVSLKLQGRNKACHWLFPNQTTPGGENIFVLHDEIVINEIMYHHRPEYEIPAEEQKNFFIPIQAVWNYNDSGENLGTAWRDPGYNDSSWPSGAALLYYDPDPLPVPKNTLIDKGNKTTFYFRTEFTFTGNTNDMSLFLHPVIDDGAVFYLNGEEIYRFNMPEGEIYATTYAASRVGEAAFTGPYTIDPAFLVQGVNVMAVEVHQHAAASSDVVFGMELFAVTNIISGKPFIESNEQWIELFNRGTGTVDISNWELDRAVDFTFPPGTILNSNEYIVVANDANSLSQLYPSVRISGNFSGRLSHREETILLKDYYGNPADEVHYYDTDPWPGHPDGGGCSLELRNPFSDNNKPEVWADSDESSRSSWQNISFRMTAQATAGPTDWNEFLMGTLQAGELLIDDISVIESPDSSPVELIQNGTFDTGTNKWRINGTHRSSEVIDDPENPGNNVLRISATAACGHSYNHAETTLVGNTPVVNGREYEISFRAKWISGTPRFRTWLYFNRCAKVTLLNIPEKSGTPGEQNSCYKSNLGPTFSEFSHFPAVPNANQEVEVSVKVNDKDGIKSCKLYWAFVEGGWFNFPMTLNSNGVYSANAPGFGTGSIVQFYVEATDNLNNKTTYPAAGADSRALYQVQDNRASSLPVHNLRVIMLDSDADRMYDGANVTSYDYERGTIIYDETQVFHNVRIRLKGNISRLTPYTGHKFLFPADNLFRGTHQSVMSDPNGRLMSLSHSFGNCQEEIFSKHIANRAGGVYSQYDDLMHIIIQFPNGSISSWKSILMMGRFDSDYFTSLWGEGDSQLFKYEYTYYFDETVDGNPESEKKKPNKPTVKGLGDIYDLGNNKEVYRWFYLIKNGRTKDDYSTLINLCKTFSLTGAELDAASKNSIDESQWMRNFAYLSLCCALDMYNFGASHNNMFYKRPADGKLLVFPVDMDLAFDPDTSRRGVDAPLWGANNGNAFNLGKIMDIPRNKRMLYAHFKDIIDKSYNPTYMSYWADHYYSLVQNLEPYDFSGNVDFIRDRMNFVLSQLPPEVPFKITTNNGEDFTTGVLELPLEGSAWIDVKQIHLEFPPTTLSLNWTTITNWQTTVQLHPGTNFIKLLGYNFSKKYSETSSITVICTAAIPVGGILINEFLAKNDTINTDELGDYDDWIELFNAGTNAENVGGMFLTDNTNFPAKWMLPDTNVFPGNFLLVWADNETNQGECHASFKLSASGEHVALFDNTTSALHTILFGPQQADISSGFFPDGNIETLYQMVPTPNETNNIPEPVIIWIVGLLVPLLRRRPANAGGCPLGRGMFLWIIGRRKK